MTDLANLALNRPATQSSRSMFSRGITPEDDACGGNNGEITGGFGFHTNYGTPPWWMVDLQAVCHIARIRLFNRIGLEDRLRHFSVLASLDGLSWTVALRKTDDSLFGGAVGEPFEARFAPPLLARFLRVQQDEPDMFLHFDEFEAYGWRDGEAPDAPPVFRGEAKLDFADTTDIAGFGLSGQHARVHLLHPMLPPPQLPMLCNIAPPPVIVQEHNQYAPPPPVCAYAVAGGQLWRDGLVTIDGKFLVLDDCWPHYYRTWIKPDGDEFQVPLTQPDKWAKREVLASDLPVASIVNPTLIYGHFLLEMLPRLYVLSILRHYGARIRLAMPQHAPNWMRAFVDLYIPASDQLWYDIHRHVIQAPSIVLPSMLHANYNFHPAFNLLVADVRARAGLPPVPGPARDADAPRRLYLSRRQFPNNKRLQNEEEVEQAMQALGFAIVHPQQMSLREQLELFDGAEIVVGENNSALHNTLFCRPGTKVVSIDYYLYYQSAIGRLRQQPLGFVAPDDGQFRHWRHTQLAERSYRVSAADVAAMVRAMLDEAPPPDSAPDAVEESPVTFNLDPASAMDPWSMFPEAPGG